MEKESEEKMNYDQRLEYIKSISDEEILATFEKHKLKFEINESERLYKLFLSKSYYIPGNSLKDIYRQAFYKYI